jgi:hypothetical protein
MMIVAMVTAAMVTLTVRIPGASWLTDSKRLELKLLLVLVLVLVLVLLVRFRRSKRRGRWCD